MPAKPLPSIDTSSIRALGELDPRATLGAPRGSLSSLGPYVEDSVGENGGKEPVREPQDFRGPRNRSGRVYVTRRLLAALVVLLLLALIVPRACQTLFGTGEDQGPGAPEEKGAGVADTKKHANEEEADAERPSGTGDVSGMKSNADSEGATPSEDTGSDAQRSSPDKDKTRTKSGTADEDAADEGAEEQVTAATVSLADLVTGPVIADGDVLIAAEDTSAEQTTPPAVATNVEEGWQADERRYLASQSPSVDQLGTGSPNATVAPAQKPRPKPPPERASGPVAEPDDEPGAEAVAPVSEPVLEPEPAPVPESVYRAPIPAVPVTPAPVPPAPPLLIKDKGFAAGVAAMPVNTSRMATGFGGGAAGNNAVTSPGAGAVRRASAVAGRVGVGAGAIRGALVGG